MRTSSGSLILLLLALTTAVFANPFWSRAEEPAEDPAAAAAVSSISAAEASASATGTAAQTNANGTAAATSASNGTAAATSSSSSSSSVSATPIVSCHISSSTRPKEKIQNPFCEPKPGQILVLGQNYSLTWDPTLFEFDSTNTVELKTVTSADNSTVIWSQAGIRNEDGKVKEFLMHDDMFEDFDLKNGTNVTLFIKSDPSENPIWSGPTMTLIMDEKTAKNGTSKGKDDRIGQKAGIPVGLGVFLIAVAGLVFWFIRRRRNRSAGYMAKRKGVSRMTGDEGGAGGGFRDEPTRGMELQDRQGHGRQDSWEAGWDSTSSQGGGGNTFREEIDRQRRR
ncbi:MAG: hypothetical protein Q9209_004858 [Squamulea sp. 1 TL-2023]